MITSSYSFAVHNVDDVIIAHVGKVVNHFVDKFLKNVDKVDEMSYTVPKVSYYLAKKRCNHAYWYESYYI